MDLLEKILMIDISCKQSGKPRETNSEFIPTYQSLSKTEKDEYHKLSPEIHNMDLY